MHGNLVFPRLLAVGAESFDLVLVGLDLLEAVRGGNLVIEVDFFLVEDENASTSHDVACWIDQVASAVDKALSSVQKLAAFTSHDDEVAHVVDLEVSHDVS